MNNLNKKNGIDIVRVPYRSGNEVITALISGATPITLLGLANMVPTLQAGHITALAVNGKSRSPLFPDVPTLQEAIGESYPQSWFGLFAPAGTPKAIITKLHREIADIASDPAFHQKVFIERAIERVVNTPQEVVRFILEDREAARRMVKESGVEPQ
jgi:tripartite-type tricarboxylate transporter receptor subunit TctC